MGSPAAQAFFTSKDVTHSTEFAEKLITRQLGGNSGDHLFLFL